MASRFHCPECRQALFATDKSAGDTTKCVSCGATVAIPAEEPQIVVAEPEPDSSDSVGLNPYQAPVADVLPGTNDGENAEEGIQHSVIEPLPILEKTWELFRHNLILLIPVSAVYIVVNLGLFFSAQLIQTRIGGEPGFREMVTFALFQFTAIVMQVFLGVGITVINLGIARGQKMRFRDLFSGSEFYWECVYATISYQVAFLIGLLLLVVPGVMVLLSCWAYMHFVVDRKVIGIEALYLAWQYSQGNKLQVLLLGVLTVGLVFAAALLLFIPIFAAVPFVSLMFTVAYLTMTGQQVHSPAARADRQQANH